MSSRGSLPTGVFLEAITADQASRVRRWWVDDGHVSVPEPAETGAYHFGVYAGDRLAAVASVSREPPPGGRMDGAWRLSGVVTDPAFRGSGLATMLVKACVNHATRRGGARLWCTALPDAEGFLARNGFQSVRNSGPTDPRDCPLMHLAL